MRTTNNGAFGGDISEKNHQNPLKFIRKQKAVDFLCLNQFLVMSHAKLYSCSPGTIDKRTDNQTDQCYNRQKVF